MSDTSEKEEKTISSRRQRTTDELLHWRRLQVIKLLSQGHTVDGAADILKLSAKTIEGARRMIKVNNNSKEEEPEIPINSATKRHFELEIETIQNAPRDEAKLRELLKLKEKQRMSKKQLTLKILKEG